MLRSTSFRSSSRALRAPRILLAGGLLAQVCVAQQFGSAQPLFSLTKQPQIAIAADLDGLVAHHAYCAFDLTSSPGAPFATFVSNAVALTLLP